MTHTKEPWHLCKCGVCSLVWASDGETLIHDHPDPEASDIHMSTIQSRINAARIVDCVNACVGMESPVSELIAIRTRVKELELSNIYLATIIKQAAEDFLSSNGIPPEWWTIPLMREIADILKIEIKGTALKSGE